MITAIASPTKQTRPAFSSKALEPAATPPTPAAAPTLPVPETSQASTANVASTVNTPPAPAAKPNSTGRFAQHIAEGLAIDAVLGMLLTALPGAGKLLGKKSLLLGAAGLALGTPILLAVLVGVWIAWKLVPEAKPAIQKMANGALEWVKRRIKKPSPTNETPAPNDSAISPPPASIVATA